MMNPLLPALEQDARVASTWYVLHVKPRTEMYFRKRVGKDSSQSGKDGWFEGMKKPRAGELQGA